MNRVINDAELAKFSNVGRQPAWSMVIDAAMSSSPYGDFGFDGQPHTYSSKCLHPDFDEDEEVSPLSREFWNAPNRCDWTSPLYLHIANEAMPDYGWQMYRLYGEADNDKYKGDRIGHTEVVGVHPDGDVVALGLNVGDIHTTLEASGWPENPIESDETVLTLISMARQKLEEAP